MPYFITRYALSRGIFEIEANIIDHHKRIINQTVDGKGINCYYHAREWWTSKDEAVKQARKMRDRKVKSLEKQIEKLKEMEFE
jgi:hypothetical protein